LDRFHANKNLLDLMPPTFIIALLLLLLLAFDALPFRW